MKQPLRWGILGTGNIAKQFAGGVAGAQRSKIVAVGSRSSESADGFASQFSISKAHGSYDALINDPEVEAIYLSLPNHMHHEWTIKCLLAGKHVLCEKPFASNASEAQEMFDVAKRVGKVLVEAFMYRSHPQTQLILETIASGAIGQLKIVRTSFCFSVKNTKNNIRFDASMAGGALMDVGCYCLNFSRMITRAEPIKMHAVGVLHESGVDESACVVMEFPNKVLAHFNCGMQNQADNSAYVCGTDGYLKIGWPWKPQQAASFTISRNIPPRQDLKPGQAATQPPEETRSISTPVPLYGLEADDFAATVQDGVSPRLSAADTIGNMKCLDELRRQIGVKF